MKGTIIENKYHFKNRTSYFQDLKDLKNTNIFNVNSINNLVFSKKPNPRK